MTTKSSANSKEKLLQAAIELFASKSYAATGLREIVRAAGVSVAMVNYHFGSKPALLTAILERFFAQIIAIAQKNLPGEQPAELKVRQYFRALIAFFRQEPELMRVAIAELPRDMPEILDCKARLIREVVATASTGLLPSLPEPARSLVRVEIVGPSIMGLLSAHFMLRPVIEKVFQQTFDDAFYQNFADELADLFLYGLFGAKKED